MHYDAIENKHGLKHDPFKAIVNPRPIGWITTVSDDGICNLAPYSFFNAVADRPHYVMFSTNKVKDSLRNIRQNGEFTCSLSTWDTRFEMNVSSAAVPQGIDEYPLSGLTAVASRFVKPPRVKESPAALECKHWRTIELPDVDPATGNGHYVVFGQVVGIYINDDFIHDGMVDTAAMKPLARLGYMDYAVVSADNIFEINRPQLDEAGNIVNARPEGWDGQYR
ncbi:MAG: flavin reductase (DIM6/NTAB) family NADH-FMN oxidoreductase RutF [Gammaproteobacteria bacterium]|jgi:flavin reductase (DIM6/NTAB) family NADH-FMN oxidoreductase RutF